MLYHTARISLNRPFVTTKSSASPCPSPASSSLYSGSIEICDTSADIIVSILNRFKPQGGLKTAPLMFVHGAIVAIDATLATAQHQSGGKPIVKDTNLPALDAALAELSHTWALAGGARTGLRDVLRQRQIKRDGTRSDPSRGLDSDVDAALILPATPHIKERMGASQSLDFGGGGLSAEPASFSQSGGLNDVDLYFWDSLSLTENVNPSEPDFQESYIFRTFGLDSINMY